MDMAWSLGISDTGTVQELRELVFGYFDKNPERKTEQRYAALFKRGRGQASSSAAAPEPPPPPPPPAFPRSDIPIDPLLLQNC